MVVRRSALQRSGDKNVSQTPFKRICAQYGFRFFDREKSKSVASTAKRQRGLQRGKLGSHLPCFASFCRSKRKAPAASGANYAFAKGPATPKATTNCPPPQATTGHNKNCPKSTPKRKEGPL